MGLRPWGFSDWMLVTHALNNVTFETHVTFLISHAFLQMFQLQANMLAMHPLQMMVLWPSLQVKDQSNCYTSCAKLNALCQKKLQKHQVVANESIWNIDIN